MAGLLVGLIRIGLSMGYQAPPCGEEDNRPSLLANVHYLHFAIILACCTFIVVVGVTLMTEPRRPEQVKLHKNL